MPSESHALRRLLPLKPLDFMLLAILQEGPLHGYALVHELSDRSDGSLKVRPGDLYRVLFRLAEQGLIEGDEPEGPAARRRREYRLSALGANVLNAEARRVADLASRVLARPLGAEDAS
ncbi:MAG: PadR family transcriptional regulator [Acidobacteriota bacterium]